MLLHSNHFKNSLAPKLDHQGKCQDSYYGPDTRCTLEQDQLYNVDNHYDLLTFESNLKAAENLLKAGLVADNPCLSIGALPFGTPCP